MPTYIMSYPGIRGRAASRNPRAAFTQWTQLCDHIIRAGGHILVLDPPPHAGEQPAPGPGLPEAAFLGALFPQPHGGQGAVFLLSRPAEGEGPGAHVAPLLARAGLSCRQASHPFAGQADYFSLGRNRYVLTLGGGTTSASLAEVRELLPTGARLLEVVLDAPSSSGIRCLSILSTPGGDGVLLVCPGGLRNHAVEEFARFASGELDVLSVGQEDALAFAASALSVRGTLLVPLGLSSGLRGQLLRRGFQLAELDLTELLPGGGGPRDLVNELPGQVLSDDAPSYTLRREELLRLAATYPESAEAG